MRAERLSWRLGRAISGTVFGAVVIVAGMGASKEEIRRGEIEGPQKATHCPPVAAGFNICFPHPTASLPNTARCVDESAPSQVDACMRRVCDGVASEPAPGFFALCCGQAEASSYPQTCVDRLMAACEDPLIDYCETQCPSLQVLSAELRLDGPLRESCLGNYPAPVRATWQADAYCRETHWDEICSTSLNARLAGE